MTGENRYFVLVYMDEDKIKDIKKRAKRFRETEKMYDSKWWKDERVKKYSPKYQKIFK